MAPSEPSGAEGGMSFVFFTAPWCGVCREKAPVADEIAAEYGLPIQRWDIEEAEGGREAERRRIRTVPTLALVRGERVPFRLVGSMITPENVRHLMDQFSGDRTDALA
jgi:thiol-disulfide isomerase/thioredoxin